MFPQIPAIEVVNFNLAQKTPEVDICNPVERNEFVNYAEGLAINSTRRNNTFQVCFNRPLSEIELKSFIEIYQRVMDMNNPQKIYDSSTMKLSIDIPDKFKGKLTIPKGFDFKDKMIEVLDTFNKTSPISMLRNQQFKSSPEII
jgi:hypothetical protein